MTEMFLKVQRRFKPAFKRKGVMRDVGLSLLSLLLKMDVFKVHYMHVWNYPMKPLILYN
jgi:hypothetical protein